MKKVLILVLSSDFPPYDKMINTSLATWDSIDVPGVKTIFYSSESEKQNTDKIIYLPVDNDLYNVGAKTLMAFEWALQNREWDYIARTNASCYTDKRRLLDFVQTIPDNDVFMGVEAQSQNGFKYCWGGTMFIISKDVVRKIVNNKARYHHEYMEDESVSLLVSELGIPFSKGIKSCSIDKADNGWKCISYCDKSKDFTDFEDLKNLGHTFYRVKNDGHRELDIFLMEELFKVLK